MQALFELAPLNTAETKELEAKEPSIPKDLISRVSATSKTQTWASFDYLYQYSKSLPKIWEMMGNSIWVKNRYELIEKTEAFNALFKSMAKEPNESKDLDVLQRAMNAMRFEMDSAADEKGCDLHWLSKLPKRKDLPLYRRYLFIKQEDKRALYTIHYESSWECTEVKIENFNLFEKQINNIKSRHENKFHLNAKQIKEIITSNGGHKPQSSSYWFRLPGRSQIQAFSSLLNKEQEAVNHEDGHYGYRLDWSKLKEIKDQLGTLKTQIEEKNYWHLNQWAFHSDCAELCEGILLVIENFSKWFTKDHIENHQNREAHPSCRRAIQDLDYLIDLLVSNRVLLKRLKIDLPQLPDWIGHYQSKPLYALQDLRTKYEKSLDTYLRRVEGIKKLQDKAPSKSKLQQTIQDALHESLSQDNSCIKALAQIRALSNAKYNENLKGINAFESHSYLKIWQIANRALQAPEEKSAEIKKEPTRPLSLRTTSAYTPKKASKDTLDCEALTELNDSIKSILALLEGQSFYAYYFIKKAAEDERMSLCKALNDFTNYFEITSSHYWDHPGASDVEKEMRLKDAQEQWSKIIIKLQTSAELVAKQPDSRLESLIHETFVLYHNKINLNLNRLYQEYQELQEHLKTVQQQYLALEEQYEESGLAWKKDQLQDLVKITCDKLLHEKSPAQNAIEKIRDCLKTLELLEPKTEMSIGVCLSIANKIIEAFMPPKAVSLSQSN